MVSSRLSKELFLDSESFSGVMCIMIREIEDQLEKGEAWYV